MITNVLAIAQSIGKFAISKWTQFRLWVQRMKEAVINWIIKQYAKQQIRRATMAIVPVANVALTLIASVHIVDMGILADYLIYGYVANAYINVFYMAMLHDFLIVILCVVLIIALKKVWQYCAAYVISYDNVRFQHLTK